jgi:hypothetical protein
LLRLSLFLLFALCQSAAPAWAGQDELEAWQSRILEALEQARERAEDASGAESEKGRDDRQSLTAPGAGENGARDAAEEAQRRFGGRPLAVSRVGEGYRVRLLLDDGRVRTVVIRD